MSFEVETAGRVSQGKYWAFFGANMILIPILAIGGVLSMLHGSVGIGFLMIAAIIPMGIYWRVIMMRRCRDIGWPAFLPWLSSGLQILASFSASSSLHSVRYGAAPSMTMLMLPLFMAFADFAFSIVIGCIRTKDGFDYAAVFGDEPDPYHRPQASQSSRPARSAPVPRPAMPGESDDRYDEAIARAFEAHRRGEAAGTAAAPPARPIPAGPARPAGGFGRRMV